jgi:hypothetical protein
MLVEWFQEQDLAPCHLLLPDGCSHRTDVNYDATCAVGHRSSAENIYGICWAMSDAHVDVVV